MIKVDTEGQFASVQAGGTTEELIKELIMITTSIARGISEKDMIGALYLIATVGRILSDEDYIASVLIDDEFGKGMVSVTKEDGETDEQAEARAMMEAMSKFSKLRPIKVDGDYNIVEDDE